MARKNKKLLDFGDTANNDFNINDNIGDKLVGEITIIDENEDKAPESNEPKESTIDKIINKPKGKKALSNYDKVLVGFHVERHLAAILDDLQRKGGKGVKSQIINELLERAFKEKGLL